MMQIPMNGYPQMAYAPLGAYGHLAGHMPVQNMPVQMPLPPQIAPPPPPPPQRAQPVPPTMPPTPAPSSTVLVTKRIDLRSASQAIINSHAERHAPNSSNTISLLQETEAPKKKMVKRYSKSKINKTVKKFIMKQQPKNKMQAWLWKGLPLLGLINHLKERLPGLTPSLQGVEDYKELVKNVWGVQIMHTDVTQTIRVNPYPPDELAEMFEEIKRYIKSKSPEDEGEEALWKGVSVSDVYTIARKLDPNFKYQKYGFGKWRKFVEFIPGIEMEKEGKQTTCRLMIPNRDSKVRKVMVTREVVRLLQTSVMSLNDVKEMIIKNFEGQSFVEGETVSIRDALTISRIKIPGRGMDCTHIRPFSLPVYMKVNMFGNMKGRWRCPVCANKVKLDRVVVDGYWLHALRNKNLQDEARDQCRVHPDGLISVVIEDDNKKVVKFIPEEYNEVTFQDKDLYYPTEDECDSEEESENEFFDRTIPVIEVIDVEEKQEPSPPPGFRTIAPARTKQSTHPYGEFKAVPEPASQPYGSFAPIYKTSGSAPLIMARSGPTVSNTKNLGPPKKRPKLSFKFGV